MSAPVAGMAARSGVAGTVAAAILCIAIVGMGLSLSIPLLSLRMDQAGFSSAEIGINTAMAGLASVAAAPFVPRAADRLGTRGILLSALALGALCLPAFEVTPFWAWYPIRFAFGVSLTVLFVMSEFWINAAAPEARRGLVMGIYATVLSLGFAAGPLVLHTVGQEGSAPFLVGSAMMAAAAVPLLLAGAGAPAVHGRTDRSVLSFLRGAPAATLAGFVYGAAETGAFSLLPVYADRNGLGADTATLVVSAVALGNVVFQIPIGWLADRLSRPVVLLGCGAVGFAGAAAIPAVAPSGGLPLLAVLFVWGGIVAGLYTVGLSLLGQRYSGPDLATANATFVILYSLGMLAGPPVMGLGMDLAGLHGLPLTIALFFLVYCAVVALRLRSREGS